MASLKEGLKYATWEKPDAGPNAGEVRYDQWMKLKSISKQLKYYFKNFYGKGTESNNDKFNLMAAYSGMESSKSEVSLDEILYDDDQSGDDDSSLQDHS